MYIRTLLLVASILILIRLTSSYDQQGKLDINLDVIDGRGSDYDSLHLDGIASST